MNDRAMSHHSKVSLMLFTSKRCVTKGEGKFRVQFTVASKRRNKNSNDVNDTTHHSSRIATLDHLFPWETQLNKHETHRHGCKLRSKLAPQ